MKLTSLLLTITAVKTAADNMLGFDIYGDSSKFDPSDSITVDPDTCEYHAEVHINFGAADPPFPSGPDDCSPFKDACNGQSCLFEVRNVYKLSKAFKKYTGFNHVGLDWSPCGHPPLDKFGKSHWNMHLFRVSPEEREQTYCKEMLNPFACNPYKEQPNIEGRKFFLFGRDANGDLANVPQNFSLDLKSGVPGEGIHVWNVEGQKEWEGGKVWTEESTSDVASWTEPVLVEGLYNGGVQFWEPMIPFEFVTGDSENFFESNETYVSQTIVSLPSYWSMTYKPETGVTTLVIKGMSEHCPKDSKSAKSNKSRNLRGST